MKPRDWQRSWIFWVPFFALFIDFLGPVVALQKSFVVADFSVQHLPWARYVYNALREGAFPFWTHAMAGGFPLAAEGQIAAFYGPHRFLQALLPFWPYYSWSIALHFTVGAFGFYGYARALRLSRAASGFSMLAYAFGSAFAGCYYNTGSLRTLAWFPFLLWITQKMPQKNPAQRVAWGVALALLVSQAWYAGFAQIALYSFAYVFCAVLLDVIQRRPGAGSTLVLYVGGAVLGTLLAAPQMVLTAELIGQSIRGGESMAFALWGSMPPTGLAALIFPEWGNIQRISFYAGAGSVFAAAAFFVLPRAKKDFRHAWLFLFFLLLSLGKFNPLYSWLVQSLSLTFLRNPSKFLFFAISAGVIVAAQGLDAFFLALKRLPVDESRSATRRMARVAAGIAAALAALPLVMGWIWKTTTPLWEKWSRSFLDSLLAEKGAAARPIAEYQSYLSDFHGALGKLFSYGHTHTCVSVLLALAFGTLFILAAWRRIPRKFFLPVFFCLCLVDFHYYGWNLGTGFIGNADRISRTDPGEEIRFLQNAVAADPGAVAEFVRDREREFLPPDRNMAHGLTHVGGYSPLLLKRYYDLVYELGIVDGSLGRAPFSEEVWRRSRGLLDWVGIKFLATDAPVHWDGFSPIGEAGKSFFYRNDLVLPDAAAWTRAIVIPDAIERLRYLKSAAFDPRAAAVTEEDSGLPNGSPPIYSVAEIQRRKPDYFQALYTLPAEGIGWARIAAYPGWKLRVDGRAQPWFRVGHAFIGFRLGPGAHLAQLSYAPNHYREALAVSGLAAVFLLWVSFRFFLGRRRLS